MLTAVAWDIDGTLVDSEPLHHRALVAVSRTHGVDLSDLPDQAFRGIHMEDVWLRLSSRMPSQLARETWLMEIEDYYAVHRSALVAMPGAVDTIKALAGLGIRQACVSNSGRRIVDANVDALGIGSLMAVTISLDDVAAGKPDPTPYAMACAALDTPAWQVLAVEDSQTGALSARAAGLMVAAYSPVEPFPGDADHVIQQLQDVLMLVQTAG